MNITKSVLLSLDYLDNVGNREPKQRPGRSNFVYAMSERDRARLQQTCASHAAYDGLAALLCPPCTSNQDLLSKRAAP